MCVVRCQFDFLNVNDFSKVTGGFFQVYAMNHCVILNGNIAHFSLLYFSFMAFAFVFSCCTFSNRCVSVCLFVWEVDTKIQLWQIFVFVFSHSIDNG